MFEIGSIGGLGIMMRTPNDRHIDLLKEARISWIYPVFVPSYSRAGTASYLRTLAGSLRSLQSKVYIVARDREVGAYREAYPWATVIPQRPPYGIGPARIRCINYARKRGMKRIFMADDDLVRINLLEYNGVDSQGHPKSRRVSHKDTEWPIEEMSARSLAVACKMADQIFKLDSSVSCGSTRMGFFSSSIDTSIAAVSGLRGFPACTWMIDTERFTMDRMPEEYQWEGEDLAMFMHNLSEGKKSFIQDVVTYDDDLSLTTTIPFSGDGEVDRLKNLSDAETLYPTVWPHLRVTNRSPSGAIRRIGMNWNTWHKAMGTSPEKYPTDLLVDMIIGGQ